MEDSYSSADEFSSLLQNAFKSEDFARVPIDKKGLVVNNYIKEYAEAKGISDQKELDALKSVAETSLEQEKVVLGINRYRPSQEEASQLYADQPIYGANSKLEEVIKSVDNWKAESLTKATSLRPADKADFEIDLEDRANAYIRDAAGKTAKTGWIWDKTSRLSEGAVKPFTDLIDKKWSDRFFAENLAENPERDTDLSSQFAGGMGQLASQIVIGSVITATAGPEAVLPAFALLYGAQYTKNGYDEEFKRSGDSDKAIAAGISQIPASLLDSMADSFLLGSGKAVKSIGKQILEASSIEAKREILKSSIPTLTKTLSQQFVSEGVLGGIGAEFASGYGAYKATGDESYLRNTQQLLESGLVEGTLGALFGGAIHGLTRSGELQNISEDLNKNISFNKAKQQDIFSALQKRDYAGAIKIAQDSRYKPIITDKTTEAKPQEQTQEQTQQTPQQNYREELKLLRTRLKSVQDNPEELKRIQDNITKLSDPNYTSGLYESGVVEQSPIFDGHIVYVKATPGQLNGTALALGTSKINLNEGATELSFTGKGSKEGSTITNKPFKVSPSPKEGYIPIKVTDSKVEGGIVRKLEIVKDEVQKENKELPITQEEKDTLTKLLAKDSRNPEEESQVKALNDRLQASVVEENKQEEVKTENIEFYGKKDTKQFEDKNGAIDIVAFSDYISSKADQALKEGKEVTLIADSGRKRVPILSIIKGMLADKDGARWGVMSLMTSEKEGLEIKDKKTDVTDNDVVTENKQEQLKNTKPDRSQFKKKKIPKYDINNPPVQEEQQNVIQEQETGKVDVGEQSKTGEGIRKENTEKVVKKSKKKVTNKNVTENNGVESSTIEITPAIDGVVVVDSFEKLREELAAKAEAAKKKYEEENKKPEPEKVKKKREKKKKTTETIQEVLQETGAPNTVILMENLNPPAATIVNPTISELAKDTAEVLKGQKKPAKVLYVDKVTQKETEIPVEKIEEIVYIPEPPVEKAAENVLENKEERRNNFINKLKSESSKLKNKDIWTDENIEKAWKYVDTGKTNDFANGVIRVGFINHVRDLTFGKNEVEKLDAVTREFLQAEKQAEEEAALYKENLDKEIASEHRYSIAGQEGSGITEEEVNNFISQLGVPISVVDTNKLTEDGHIWSGRTDFNTINGKVRNVRITINIANIRNIEHLKNVINEELAHTIYNDAEMRPLIDDIINASTVDQSLIDKYQEDDLTEESAVRFVAELVDKYDKKGSIDKFISALKTWFKKVFGLELKESELSYLASKAIRASLKRIDFNEGVSNETNYNLNDYIGISAGDFLYGIANFKNGQIFRKDGKPLQVSKNGTITEKEFKNFGGVNGALTDAEIDFYKLLVPNAFTNNNVNIQNLIDGLNNIGESVRVDVYGQEGNASEAKQKLDAMQHEWLDNEPSQVRAMVDFYALSKNADLFLPDLQQLSVDLSKAAEYRKYYQAVENEKFVNNGPKATSSYNQISPFDTKKFPVVRVDVVLPVPENSIIKKGAPGIPVEAPWNRKREGVLWNEDNLHENLPNTLGWAMVQFVPDPRTGETVAFVGEQQSRWGQERARYSIEPATKPGTFDVWYRETGGNKRRVSLNEPSKEAAQQYIDSKAPPHPILESQANLVLKAVIREVQKRGVNKIVISDGETAMMTEEHDVGHGPTPRKVYEEHPPKTLKNYDDFEEWAQKREKELKVQYPSDRYEIRNEDWIEVFDKLDAPISRPSQEGGMRLHYDTTLPSVMKKLTGGEGEMWDGGVHKNAVSPEQEDSFVSTFVATEAEAKQLASSLSEGQYFGPSEFGFQVEGYRIPKGSPVFRNPDGTPKSSVTGLSYDISNIANREPYLLGTRYNKTSTQEANTNINSNEEMFDIDEILNGTISKEKRDAIKEVGKLRKIKLEQSLIVDEKQALNLLNQVNITFLSNDRALEFANLIKNFIETRSRQKEPPAKREESARNIIAKSQEFIKESNKGQFDYIQSLYPELEGKTFEGDFENDLKLVADFIKQLDNKEETFNTNISEEELNVEERLQNLQEFARENNDIVLQSVNRMANEVAFSTNNESLQEFIPIVKELGQESLQKRLQFFTDYANSLLSDIDGLTFKQKRQKLYALHSLFADGYPLYSNSFLSNETQQILQQKLEGKIFPYISAEQAGAITEKITGFAPNIRRLGPQLSNLIFKLVTPFREGVNKSELIQERVIKPYLKKAIKKAESISGKRYNQYDLNKIGIFSYLVAYRADETQSQGLKRNIDYLKESISHYTYSYDKTFVESAKEHQAIIDKFLEGIDIESSNPIDQLMQTAELDEGMKGYHKDIIDMFEMVKPLSKFNTEFAYGRPFDEWINYVPAFSVRTDSESITDPKKEILSMDSDSHALGELDQDRNMQRQGMSATKDRTRRLGKHRVLVFNINQLAESRMRLNLLDIFTAIERRELVNLLSENGAENKTFHKWLNPEGINSGREGLIYRTVLQAWQHSIQSASFASKYDVFINQITRLIGSVKLSSAYQFFAQGISNVLPFFVTNINNPLKASRFFTALNVIAKYKAGKLDPRSTKTVERLLAGIAMRKQDQFLDKSIKLNVSGKEMFQAFKSSPLFSLIENANEIREKIMFAQFKYSDMVSGDPIILAEYISNEIEAGRGNEKWDGITYNEQSYFKALDETERFIGIGGATRRGAFMHNGQWPIVMLRNILTAFASHRINNATNFEIEFNQLRSGNLTPEQRNKSIRYMMAIAAQSISFGAVKWGITLGIFNVIRGALEEDENENKLKSLYRKLVNANPEDAKKIQAEISMRQNIRSEWDKVKNRTEDKKLLAVNIAADTVANSFVITAGFDFITNYVVHLVYDKNEEVQFRETKEEKLASLTKKIKNAENLGEYTKAAELTLEKKRIDSQEVVLASFENRGFIPFAGAYGMALKDIANFGDAVADSVMQPDVKAFTWYDASLALGAAGLMQADYQKFLKMEDKIIAQEMLYNKKIKELKEKARKESRQ